MILWHFFFRMTLMECSKGNSPSQSRWGKVKSFFSFFTPLVSWWTYIPEFINRTPLSGFNAKFQWKTAVFGIEIGVWVKHHLVSTFGSNTTRELPSRPVMKSSQDLLDDAKDPGADPVAVKAMKTFDLMDKVACDLYLYGIQGVLFLNAGQGWLCD